MKRSNLLEDIVEKIFKKSGFKTKRNVFMSGYEIDVLAEYKGYKIVIECKERTSKSIVPRNVIHEWISKKNYINADRFLIVFYGVNISENDRKLSKENDIYVWDDSEFNKFLCKMIENDENILVDILNFLNISTEDVIKRIKKLEELKRKWKPNKSYWHCILERFNFEKKMPDRDETILICGYSENTLSELARIYHYSPSNPFKIELDLDAILRRVSDSILENITLIFPRTIGKKEVKLAEKYGFKYVVCEKIKRIGLFESELRQRDTKVKIITYKNLKELVK